MISPRGSRRWRRVRRRRLAGFQPGDEIVAWDGQRLEFSSRDERRGFDRALRTSVNVGDIVPVKVKRDDGQGGVAEADLRLVAR